MNKWLFIVVCLLFISLSGIFFFGRASSPAIIYFPIDKKTSFVSAGTEVEFITEKNKNKYEIGWTSESTSSSKVYLRQDASLLFDNGRLRGVLSKWRENEDTIRLEKNIISEDSSLFQAISYHHGEVHYPDDQIKSIQQMSYDELYVVDSPATPLESFQSPKNEFDKEWKDLLDVTTNQQLWFHWNQLIHYYKIQKDSYHLVPLTDLYQYNHESLPGMSKQQTAQVIGQLWEGIYKNYIIPLVSSDPNEAVSSYIPLIMLAKDNSHLYVLFELNGEKQKLIQKLQNPK